MDQYKRIFQFGKHYTSIYIKGELVAEGGRNPLNRIELIPIDFQNKTVLDLGCNCGGILFALSDKISKGIGYEVNQDAVDNANLIKETFNVANLEFYAKDLEKLNEIKFPKVDVVFMLSIARWVRTWTEVITKINPKTLIFEAHGKPHEVEGQVAFLKEYFKSVTYLATYREQRMRHLYICNNDKQLLD